MTNRSLCLGLALAGFALVVGLPAPASAGPGLVVTPSVGTPLVQEAGYYKRRWRYRRTHVHLIAAGRPLSRRPSPGSIPAGPGRG